MTRRLPFELGALWAALVLGAPVTVATLPANDTCGAASVVTPGDLPFVVTLDTAGGDEDADAPAVPCVTPAPVRPVWFTFTPSTADTYQVATAGTTPVDYEPVVSVYTGSCAQLVPVADACERGSVRLAMDAGTTYFVAVAGAPVHVDPGIRVFVNGVEVCPGGGGDCGTAFDAQAGDVVKVVAYNRVNGRPIPAGSFAWDLGRRAKPSTGKGSTVSFGVSASARWAVTTVTLTYTAPAGRRIIRRVTMRVPADGASVPPGSLAAMQRLTPQAHADTAVLQSAGGFLALRFERVPPSYPFGYVVPSVANVVGVGGRPFVSDVTITNLATVEASYSLQLWTSREVKLYGPFSIPPGGTRELPNVVGSLFGIDNGYGTLLIQATSRSLAGARTYAPAHGGGTNGQFANAVDATTPRSSGLLASDEEGVFLAVRHDAAFRTNLGLFNVSATACTVELEVHGADGAQIGLTTNVTVAARQYLQWSLAEVVPGVEVRQAVVAARNVSHGCLVGGIAYVIDNASEDPFAVPMTKRSL